MCVANFRKLEKHAICNRTMQREPWQASPSLALLQGRAMAPLIFTLVLSVFAKGAVEACCHHTCPEQVPKSGDKCTPSLALHLPPITCEYNEHCQTCDGEMVCDFTTFAKCVGRGALGKWVIATADIAPCPPCEKKRNVACPLIYRPVCGSNGKTYANECLAKADCQFEFTEGTCCPKEAPKSGGPCALSSAIKTCEYDEHCQTCDGEKVCANTTFATCKNADGGLGGKWAIAMARIAPCPPCEKGSGEPELCTGEYDPVCGLNGKTYSNACEAEADCQKWTKGKCECKKGRPKPCPKIYRPVCGSNGITYPNACVAKADCEFDFTKGKCECDKGSGEPVFCADVYDPVCGLNGETYGNACQAEADCQKWTKGECKCEKDKPWHTKPCPAIYDPVCASNGETYGNECMAKADCELKWTKGVCCKDTTSKCKKLKKCKKRNTFPKSCQATCAVRCLKDQKFAKKKCPKDHKKKCPPRGKLLDCTDPKTKKACPGSCGSACVLPHNCFTKEVWSEEKTKWCCDKMQLGCPALPASPP